jgi:hypothetical protein
LEGGVFLKKTLGVRLTVPNAQQGVGSEIGADTKAVFAAAPEEFKKRQTWGVPHAGGRQAHLAERPEFIFPALEMKNADGGDLRNVQNGGFFHQKANFGGAARHGVSNVGNKIDLFNFAGGK